MGAPLLLARMVPLRQGPTAAHRLQGLTAALLHQARMAARPLLGLATAAGACLLTKRLTSKPKLAL